MLRKVSTIIASLAFVSAAVPAFSAVSGTLNITGDVQFGATTADFIPVAGGAGEARLGTVETGSFAGLVNTTAQIKDLNLVATPAGSAISVPSFLTLAGNPNIRLDLTFIEPGVFSSADLASPPAAGQTATPPADVLGPGPSPLNLINIGPSSSLVGFAARGVATDLLTGETSPFTASLSTQFPNMPYQQLVAIAASGGTVSASYSATIVVVPEPASIGLMLGAAGLVAVRRRRA